MTPFMCWRTVGQALRWARRTATHTQARAAGGRRIHTWRIDDQTAVDITLTPGDPDIRVTACTKELGLTLYTDHPHHILAVLVAAQILPDRYAPDGGREAVAARAVLDLAEDLERVRIVEAAGKAIKP